MATTARSDALVEPPQQGRQALLRLFCFPYAGRGPSIFRTWNDDLPAEVEVYPVQIPGRESRLGETPFVRLSPLVERLLETLSPRLNMPFAFFGHSMGALISFELARRLRKQNSPSPIQMFVSGHRAPHLPISHFRLHHLPEPALLQGLRHLNGTPEQVLQNAELVELLLPIVRADLAICENYQYQPEDPLDCPIAAFGGLQDSMVSPDDLASWHAQTTRPFTLNLYPGDHFFLHSARDSLLSTLFQKLQRLLCPIRGGQPS
jgi:surfactin synthase thioesterase subunit